MQPSNSTFRIKLNYHTSLRKNQKDRSLPGNNGSFQLENDRKFLKQSHMLKEKVRIKGDDLLRFNQKGPKGTKKEKLRNFIPKG